MLFSCVNIFTREISPGISLVFTSYIEDITRWREYLSFMFEWEEQYPTSERSERVRYCSCHKNIKFIHYSLYRHTDDGAFAE